MATKASAVPNVPPPYFSQGSPATAVQLSQQALVAELEERWQDAYDTYHQLVHVLKNVIATGQKKSEERRRAKLQLKHANERITLLQYVMMPNPSTGQKTPAPPPLPSLLTIQREWNNPGKTVLLTLVENGSWRSLPPQSDPVTGSIINAPSHFLTPSLSPELPDYTYHVYMELYTRFPSIRWINMHIKDHTKQTVYTVSAQKHRRYQIPSATMFRAAAYDTACAQITISPVRPVPNSDAASRLLGRPLTIATSAGTTVVDAPDRLQKEWTPSRFNYGGRRFVWKESSNKWNIMEDLYEVKREWDKPGSKTGKKEDETFERRLMWGDTKFSLKKAGVLHMAGGLDQIFREFLLASAVTRLIIKGFGHD